MDTDPTSLRNHVPNERKSHFVFKERDTINLLRQVIAGNPFKTTNAKEINAIWESIAENLKAVQVTVQSRSIKLKVASLLEKYDKKEKKTPPTGTEENYGELEVLLGELSELVKEEKERVVKAAIDAPSACASRKQHKSVKNNQKEQRAGQEIREASLKTMNPRKRSPGMILACYLSLDWLIRLLIHAFIDRSID